jgi:uncharacterized Tic20 family protein
LATASAGAPAALTQDETTFASLAHFLQLVTWFIGPLVIYIVKRQSPFIAFHAIQVVLFQIAYTMFVFFSIVAMFVAMFTLLEPGKGPAAGTPALGVVFPLIWLLIVGAWALMLYLAIAVGIKAARGQWAEYPLLGRWARNLVGA